MCQPPPQARSVGDDGLVEGLRASCRVMEIQIAVNGRMARLLAAAQRGGGGEQVRGSGSRFPVLLAQLGETSNAACCGASSSS